MCPILCVAPCATAYSFGEERMCICPVYTPSAGCIHGHLCKYSNTSFLHFFPTLRSFVLPRLWNFNWFDENSFNEKLHPILQYKYVFHFIYSLRIEESNLKNGSVANIILLNPKINHSATLSDSASKFISQIMQRVHVNYNGRSSSDAAAATAFDRVDSDAILFVFRRSDYTHTYINLYIKAYTHIFAVFK